LNDLHPWIESMHARWHAATELAATATLQGPAAIVAYFQPGEVLSVALQSVPVAAIHTLPLKKTCAAVGANL